MKKRTKTLMQYINAHGGDAAFKHGPGKNLNVVQMQEVVIDLAEALKNAQSTVNSTTQELQELDAPFFSDEERTLIVSRLKLAINDTCKQEYTDLLHSDICKKCAEIGIPESYYYNLIYVLTTYTEDLDEYHMDIINTIKRKLKNHKERIDAVTTTIVLGANRKTL